jgi:hypothetical protein
MGTIPNQGIFGIKIGETPQEFYGRVDRVISVSFQEYTTGAFIVSEVVVDMSGSNQLLRFYHTRPVSLDKEGQKASNSVRDAARDANITLPEPETTLPNPTAFTNPLGKVDEHVAKAASQMVVKTYPSTTHAKTVEFAVKSKEELLDFYKKFRDLFIDLETQVSDPDAHSLAREYVSAENKPRPTRGPFLTASKLGKTLFIIEE